jgi:hypothetical protein
MRVDGPACQVEANRFWLASVVRLDEVGKAWRELIQGRCRLSLEDADFTLASLVRCVASISMATRRLPWRVERWMCSPLKTKWYL